jgi:hypothetical protein
MMGQLTKSCAPSSHNVDGILEHFPLLSLVSTTEIRFKKLGPSTHREATGCDKAESSTNVYKDVHLAHRLDNDAGRLNPQVITELLEVCATCTGDGEL